MGTAPVPTQWNAAQWNAGLFGGGTRPPGLITQVGNSLLYPALRKAAVTLGPQRTPSPAQYQDAIEELNRLIGSLNCDRFFIYSVDIYLFPLTGKMTYTIGQDPSGIAIADFDAPRPQGIDRANIVMDSGGGILRFPVGIITDRQWALIQQQELINTIPNVLYNDRAYPISTLYLYGQPIPGYQLELYVWHLVPTFQSTSDVVLLPPGYEDALVLNLAVRLAPHFQRIIPPDVREDARLSLMRLESLNAPQPVAPLFGLGGCGGGFNIYSGEWEER